MGIKLKDLPPYMQTRLLGKKFRKVKNRPEQDLQIGIFNQLIPLMNEQNFKYFMAAHSPNGGWRTPVEAGVFKAMGVMPGFADILLMFPCMEILDLDNNGIRCVKTIGHPRVVFIELKAGRNSQEDSQIVFESRIKRLGFEYILLAPKSLLEALHAMAQILALNGVPVGIRGNGLLYTVQGTVKK